MRTTLFRTLVLERGWSLYATFNAKFAIARDALAGREQEPALYRVTVSKRTFERWLAGDLKSVPHPNTRRVLEFLFGVSAAALFEGGTCLLRHDTSEPAATTVVAGALTDRCDADCRGDYGRRQQPTPTLGDGPAHDDQEVEPMLRRGFVVTAAAGLSDVVLGPTALRGRVARTDVSRLRAAVDRLYAFDDVHGGERLTAIAEKHTRWIGNVMVRCSYPPGIGRELYRLRGELHACAGWFAFDSVDHARAERNFASGLRDALLAGDRLLQARIWAYMARQAWELGRATETVTIAHTALDATRRGRDPRLSALLHGRLALGYAAGGDSARFGQSLARAEAHLDRAEDDSPAWLAFVGPGEVLGSSAMAHMCLKRPDRAVRDEEQGLVLLDPRFRRNRFAKLVHLARCHHASRQHERALEVAGRALDLYPSVACPRWATQLGRLRRDVDSLPFARGFAERHDALVLAQTGGHQ